MGNGGDKARSIADQLVTLCRHEARRKTTGHITVRIRLVDGDIRNSYMGLEKPFRPGYEENLTFHDDGIN